MSARLEDLQRSFDRHLRAEGRSDRTVVICAQAITFFSRLASASICATPAPGGSAQSTAAHPSTDWRGDCSLQPAAGARKAARTERPGCPAPVHFWSRGVCRFQLHCHLRAEWQRPGERARRPGRHRGLPQAVERHGHDLLGAVEVPVLGGISMSTGAFPMMSNAVRVWVS